MKRLLTILLTVVTCTAFVLGSAGNVVAVEKKDKPKSESSEKDKKPADSKSKKDKKKPEKKYDDFIDKNKNGVDDRRENLKKKDGKKPSSEKKEG
ncbi:hypothetical protein GF377_03400 [candidate division GN15 bacterium]|nr:hypothetical protein [candidate division GN15 bacterium]